MYGPLSHVARKTNGFDLRGDLSLGDGQGVLKMVAVTYSKKASNWRRDKELCSVSKGLILGIPTDKTETKFQSEQKSNFRDSQRHCVDGTMGDFEVFVSNQVLIRLWVTALRTTASTIISQTCYVGLAFARFLSIYVSFFISYCQLSIWILHYTFQRL